MPIRTRLTLVSAGLMAAVLGITGAFLFLRLRADLRESVDDVLRFRGQALASDPDGAGLAQPNLIAEPDDAFAQVLTPDGRVLRASEGQADAPLVDPALIAGLTAPVFLDGAVATGEAVIPARLLAVPMGDGRIAVVGANLEDQEEALARLAALMLVIGPVALVLAGLAGWLVAGAALRPVERMRADAAAISASEPQRRLAVPGTGDELARLGETLNRMLERLSEAMDRERRFVDDASHEIRTPLANLRTELELALRRSRTPDELEAALRSAAQETDRLSRLAEDLLVLSRADRGRLPVRREPVDVGELIESVVAGFAARASDAGVRLEAKVPAGLTARLDPLRIRQAVGNLLDNALAHSPSGGTVHVEAEARGEGVSIEVTDSGEGFAAGFLPRAFEPFARPDVSRSRAGGGAGLGLAIVRAVAEAHGGAAEARNRPEGGALVVLVIPS